MKGHGRARPHPPLGARPGGGGGGLRPDEGLVGGPVELGAEHHLEVGAAVNGEPDVGHAHLEEAGLLFVGVVESGGQQIEAISCDGGEQTGFVAEVVSRRGVGHPGPSSDVAQTDVGGTVIDDGAQGGLDQRSAKVAVVVAASGGVGFLRRTH